MSARPLSVGLLFGGESPEHEVSIVSAKSIARHLDPKRFEVRPIGISRDGVWVVRDDPFRRLSAGERPQRSGNPFLPLEVGAESAPLPDVFFNAIHGATGEDGQLQGYLELLHRPYTGAGLLAMAAGMDKWITKRVWASEGLPVVPSVGVTEEQWRRESGTVLRDLAHLGLPVFLKPANLGSSIGVEKVKRSDDLPEALDRAFTFDRRVLVEQGMDVRELEVAVLGGDDPLVSVPGEILVAGEFYDFKDKYLDGKSRTRIPAELPPELSDLVRSHARAAFRALDAYGMARVDFFLDRRSGRVYLNEINLIPGFTSISMYPKLMEASGVPYQELLSRLIDLAMARHEQMKGKHRGFTSGSDWFA
ncbi:MAG: D-alanine--D-alanine ligase [Acidobacteria bacterium]|nr:D-alanine--D-alanine ligase [Acidobacteriota bacterium]